MWRHCFMCTWCAVLAAAAGSRGNRGRRYENRSIVAYSESDILSVTHVSEYNIAPFGSVLHTRLKMKNRGILLITNIKFKKKHRRGCMYVMPAETRNYCILFLA